MGGSRCHFLQQLSVSAALEGYLLLFVAALVVLSLVGLVVLLTRKKWMEVILLVLIPALLLYLPGIASNARFRAPVEPFLAILAALGLDAILSLLRRRRGEAL